MAIQRYQDDVWYFAYGSNMDWDRKEERTGKIREARVARLHGYRLAFNKRGGKSGQIYANIMPDESGVTWGVIYRCCPEAISTLDRYEGVRAGHYSRETIKVVPHDDEPVEALVYIAVKSFCCDEGIPSTQYLGHILNGARLHGLPVDYIAAIERLAGSDQRTDR